jgi:hypothetical protein
MQYPEISLLVQQAQLQTFKPSAYAIDLDYITVELYQYQNHDRSPKNETTQDIIWCAEDIKPRSQWNISEETSKVCSANIKMKR